MYAVLVFAILACAAQGHLIPQIIGGKNAPEGKYPYQISLRYRGSHTCGGSIIDANNVLTAAHCVEGRNSNPGAFAVYAGTTKQSGQAEIYTVESIAIHPDRVPSRFSNDVAVLHLAKSIQFNSKVQAIKLATTNIDEGPCVLTGWGSTRLGGSTPENLQEIDLELYPYEKCKARHSTTIEKSHICTLTKAGEGACHGDSGGPLVANGVQVGVVSFGRPCAIGYPDVYARVSSFASWIDSVRKF